MTDRPRSPRCPNLSRLVFSIGLRGVLWLFACPALAGPGSYVLEDQTGLETANIALMSIFTGAMFLAVGASLGSFLNVVIYRWPRGMNLSQPPSMCPQCHTPIERRDNLPMISWFRLRGRCRACQSPIPVRYPAVEIFAGCLFVGLLFVELLSGGTNLPWETRYHYAGVLWILWYTKWDLVGLYGFHLLLLMTLTALALMQRDGFIPRWRPWRTSLATPVAVFMLAALTVLPHLHVVPFLSPMPAWIERLQWMTPVQDHWLSGWTWNVGLSVPGFLSGLTGGVIGWIAAVIVREVLHRLSVEARDVSGLGVTLPLCGLCLGWQAAVCLAAGTFLIMLAVKGISLLLPSSGISSSEVMLVLALLLIFNWRTVHLGWGNLWNLCANNFNSSVRLFFPG